jgi:sugar lactone lactonase YvrE
MKIPSGLETNRPDAETAPAGSIYFNNETYRFEGLHDFGSGSKEWKPFGGVVDIDSDTYIQSFLNMERAGLRSNTLLFKRVLNLVLFNVVENVMYWPSNLLYSKDTVKLFIFALKVL